MWVIVFFFGLPGKGRKGTEEVNDRKTGFYIYAIIIWESWLIAFYLKQQYKYCNSPKYSDSQAFANSEDSDQMLQIVTSNQGLHCLTYIQQYFRHMKR